MFNPRDNVAVALRDLSEGEDVEVSTGNEVIKIKLLNNIPFGHKFALKDIRKGEYVIKYGELIGIATRDIRKGEHVHIHNIAGLRIKATQCS